MLHALLLILPLVQIEPAPTPAPDATQSAFRQLLAQQTEAPGVRLDLKMRMEGEAADGTPVLRHFRLHGTLARPAAGSLTLSMPANDDEPAVESELLGTGEAIYLLDHTARIAIEMGKTWGEADMGMVHLLSVWAGSPKSESSDLASLPATEEHPNWSGVQFRSEDSLHTIWFEGDAWRESLTELDGGMRMTTEVTTWELLTEVDEEALRGKIPLLYSSGAQEPQVDPLPPVETFPGGDAEAVAYLQTALARYARADALHFRLSGTAQDDESFGTVVIEGKIAKPAAGHLDISTRTLTTDADGVEQEQLDSLSMLGNGEGIRQVDHSRRLLVDAPISSWAESLFITDLPAFQTWAGAAPIVMHDLSFAQADPENYPGHVGLQWLDESDGLMTMWFDTGGAWVATHVVRDIGPDMQVVFWVAVESMELVSDIDPANYYAESPAGYGVEHEDGLELLAEPPPPPPEAFDYDSKLFPHADADALAYLLAFRDRCAAAPALHFEAEAVMDSPNSHAEIGLKVRAMLPASGTIESHAKMYRVEESALHLELERNFTYLGDGKQIFELDYEDMIVSGMPVAQWSQSAVVGGLFVFAAWTGGAQKTLHGLAFAEPQAERAGQIGVTWQTDNRQQQTWWFDADGNWVSCTMVDGVDEGASTVRMTVTKFLLVNDPDPVAYRTELPNEFR